MMKNIINNKDIFIKEIWKYVTNYNISTEEVKRVLWTIDYFHNPKKNDIHEKSKK